MHVCICKYTLRIRAHAYIAYVKSEIVNGLFGIVNELYKIELCKILSYCGMLQ